MFCEYAFRNIKKLKISIAKKYVQLVVLKIIATLKDLFILIVTDISKNAYYCKSKYFNNRAIKQTKKNEFRYFKNNCSICT